MKVVVDTNVILDFFLSREPYVSEVKKLFEQIYLGKIDAFATANSITDVYYVTAKKLGDVAAREAIKHLLKMLGIISVDGSDCANALSLPLKDYEDALVVTCASKEQMDFIISNDNDFLQVPPVGEGIKVVNLCDFLSSEVKRGE